MLGTLVAGRYLTSWNAVDLGQSEQGVTLDFEFKHEVIEESDAYGLSITDLVIRGVNTYLNATLKEYKAGSLAILWPLGGGVMGRISNAANPIGTFASAYAKPLVMSAVASTPAATSPASLTAPKAWIAPNYQPSLLFDSRLRKCPIRLIFLPDESGGTVAAFTTT